MKKVNVLLLLCLVSLFFAACKKIIGEGPIVTNFRTIVPFKTVEMQLPGTLYYTKDSVTRLKIETTQDIQDVIETVQTDNRLVVRIKKGFSLNTNVKIDLFLSAPHVQSLVTKTSGNIIALTDINEPDIFLKSEASGSIRLKGIQAEKLEVSNTASASISAEGGAATEANFTSSGSGPVDFFNTIVKRANVKTQGSGFIKTNVTDQLKVTIEGSGSVYFKGSPLVFSYISGNGQLFHY